MDIDTIVRNDNPNVVEHARQINSVSKAGVPNGFLESNREELDINKWLALSHIAGV